ncbi:DNA ligase N terminus-domain-containing protein [Dunaliella salina]|uniref:DNA ligase N terminus-domain-containing protein n=1 Tax=Dunaliella salina TaxID=3046 RepID=A0ABQ7G406_DUNSA|nr:DNA ligase N terminus-domain-containing protein [Dunaliella salina]|eukprot:KAF5829350.1 DNA ligase N terminus-domain-containing protein [Dunaliella salina]
MATQGPAKRDVPRGPQYETCAELPFQRLAHFFGLVSGQIPLQGNVPGKGLPPKERGRLLRRFMELYMPRTHDTYQIMRLLAPDADRVQRGSYHLQQTKLAKALCMAANVPKGSEQESNVINWRTRGSSKFVGDFPEACHKYVLNMCRIPETALERKLDLTVGMVNEKLDELASRARPNLEQKAETLKWFMQRTTSLQMKWIVCLILQHLKIGMAEETIIKVCGAISS